MSTAHYPRPHINPSKRFRYQKKFSRNMNNISLTFDPPTFIYEYRKITGHGITRIVCECVRHICSSNRKEISRSMGSGLQQRVSSTIVNYCRLRPDDSCSKSTERNFTCNILGCVCTQGRGCINCRK